MCQAVLSTTKTLEKILQPSLNGSSKIPLRNGSDSSFFSPDTYCTANAVKGRMSVIDRAYTARTGDVWYKHPSVWEISYRCMQIGFMFLIFIILIIVGYDVAD